MEGFSIGLKVLPLGVLFCFRVSGFGLGLVFVICFRFYTRVFLNNNLLRLFGNFLS